MKFFIFLGEFRFKRKGFLGEGVKYWGFFFFLRLGIVEEDRG